MVKRKQVPVRGVMDEEDTNNTTSLFKCTSLPAVSAKTKPKDDPIQENQNTSPFYQPRELEDDPIEEYQEELTLQNDPIEDCKIELEHGFSTAKPVVSPCTEGSKSKTPQDTKPPSNET